MDLLSASAVIVRSIDSVRAGGYRFCLVANPPSDEARVCKSECSDVGMGWDADRVSSTSEKKAAVHKEGQAV